MVDKELAPPPSTAPLASPRPSTSLSASSSIAPFVTATEPESYKDSPVWIKAFAYFTIGFTLLIFLAAMTCCQWRIKQSNERARVWREEEERRERDVERRMVERIRQKRKRRKSEQRRLGTETETDDGETDSSQSSRDSSQSSQDEGTEERTLIGRNLNDEEPELKKGLP